MHQPGARAWDGRTALGWLRSWVEGLPLVTKCTLTIILSTFLAQAVTGNAGESSLCLQAPAVLKLQVWRIVTSVFIHAGVLHVLFNLLAYVPLAQALEARMGSVGLAHLTLVLIGAQSALYVLLTYALAFSRLYPEALSTCVLGFSGVIFGLIAVENSHYMVDGPLGMSPQRSLFGLVSIPMPLYPWALLFLWQLIVPQASFLGHLSGLLAGLLWVGGHLRPLGPLTRSAAAAVEASAILRATHITTHPSFVPHPLGTLPVTADHSTARGRSTATGLPAGLASLARNSVFARMFAGGSGAGHRTGAGPASGSGGTAAGPVPGSGGPGPAAAHPPTSSQTHRPAVQHNPVGSRSSSGDKPALSVPASSSADESASARAAAAAAAEARALRAAAAPAGQATEGSAAGGSQV